jgi:hypothetical protein
LVARRRSADLAAANDAANDAYDANDELAGLAGGRVQTIFLPVSRFRKPGDCRN